MKTVIYGLFCPLSGAIRYIGKSSEVQKRFMAHMYAASSTAKSHRQRWMAKVLEAGFKPSLVILEEVGDHETWQQAEKRWISKALDQGWPLTNTSSGGDGSSPLNEAEKALKKAYMSSEETRRKMSESAKARWADPEKRARGVAGLSSPERRKVGSDEAKKRATPEYRAMMSEKTRSMWADPERRAVIVAGITDETRAAVSAAASRMWNESDDEKRAKMLANLTANQ